MRLTHYCIQQKREKTLLKTQKNTSVLLIFRKFRRNIYIEVAEV